MRGCCTDLSAVIDVVREQNRVRFSPPRRRRRGGGDEAFSRYGESNTWPRVIDDAKTHRNFGAAI